ncbi:MAG: hypothetical protein DRJ61_03890 [Acidobacteria bacterium]|nr:MAG: hypothetical protein DRJ61_03890 [Acidobacteriota bacterium]
MIDEKTDEILSRHLDGDLDAEEARLLTERLKRDPAIVEGLNEMQRLRQSLRQLALDERPPKVLDQMVRPLRRAGRPMRQRWAAAALVAAAAVVVVGVIVVEEIGRTGWMPWTQTEKAERQIFALSNLPARDPDAPIGAVESLLSREDPEPTLAEPELLEMIGPLNFPPGSIDFVMAIKIDEVQIPISFVEGARGLELVLEIEQGQVVSCTPQDGIGNTSTADEICRLMISIAGTGLGDGQHRGVVVRWKREGR